MGFGTAVRDRDDAPTPPRSADHTFAELLAPMRGKVEVGQQVLEGSGPGRGQDLRQAMRDSEATEADRARCTRLDVLRAHPAREDDRVRGAGGPIRCKREGTEDIGLGDDRPVRVGHEPGVRGSRCRRERRGTTSPAGADRRRAGTGGQQALGLGVDVRRIEEGTYARRPAHPLARLGKGPRRRGKFDSTARGGSVRGPDAAVVVEGASATCELAGAKESRE